METQDIGVLIELLHGIALTFIEQLNDPDVLFSPIIFTPIDGVKLMPNG